MYKIIKNNCDYENALLELDKFMDNEPAQGTSEYDEFELLSFLIENYESRNFPIEMPDPVEAVKFRMEQENLKQKDLIPYIGSRSKVSEVLSGKRKLSLNMIRALNKGLGIPLDVLIMKNENTKGDNRTFLSKVIIKNGGMKDVSGDAKTII